MSVPFKGKINVDIRDSGDRRQPFKMWKRYESGGIAAVLAYPVVVIVLLVRCHRIAPTALPARPGPVSGPGRREALSGR